MPQQILQKTLEPECEMLENLNNDDENFYYSVPRPYKCMID